MNNVPSVRLLLKQASWSHVCHEPANRETTCAWSVWPRGLEHRPVTKLRVQFPVGAQARVVGSIPVLGVHGRQPIDASLPRPLSQNAVKNHPRARIK